ncbi:MAG TPA: hypothetical protein VKW08_07450 [Xanthobacteraceae bacterium]|nr:hypothetical protein [Xanthobacteraceae bacterium]
MSRLKNLIVAGLGLTLALDVSPLHAATVDLPIYSQAISFEVGSSFVGPGQVGPVQQPPPAPADLSFTGMGISAHNTNNYAAPSLSAYASVPSIVGLGGDVQSNLTYFIRFNGKAGTVDVPVHGAGSASLSFASTIDLLSFANAQLSISNLDGADVPLPAVAAFCDFTSCPSGKASLSLNKILPFIVGDEYKVEMIASIGNIGSDALTGSAFIDPFFITPAGYTLDISQGIGNSPLSATPLPAALPLFASGLGAMGLFGWRRKRKAQVVV